MNYKTTLILLILLAVVGGYFYFAEFGKVSSYEVHQQKQKQTNDQPEGELVFTDLDADTIDRITIERGQNSVTLTKEADNWFQTEPVRFPLDSHAPNNITYNLANLRYVERVSPDDEDAPTPEQMGLDTPRATLSFHHGDNDTTLKLGKHTLGGHAYIQIDGKPDAYIVENNLHGAALDQNVEDWRSRSLDLPDAAEATSADLFLTSADNIHLQKKDGKWQIDSKISHRVSQAAIQQWFSSLGGIWINDFVEDNPQNLALYGLDADYMRLQIVEPGANDTEIKHTLYIGGDDLEGKNRYAAISTTDDPIGVIFTVNAATIDSLMKTQMDFCDPQAVPAETYDVRELTVEKNGRTTLHLIRDLQAGYVFGDPAPGYNADYIASQDMVQNLCELQSTEYVTDLSTLGTPTATVRIKLAEQDSDVVFKVYDQGDKRAIVNQGEAIAYLVPAGELNTLLGSTLALRDRTIFDIEPSSITKMTLKRDDGQVFTFEPTTNDDQSITWKLMGFDNVEQDAIDALPELLNPLKASTWLSEPVEPMGDWIEWTIEPVGGAPITLKASPNSGRALMTGIDTAFVLPQDVLEKLKAEFRGRTVINLNIDQISSVKLASDITAVTLTRTGRQYTIDNGEVDQPQAAAVFDTLSGLQADRYTQPMSLLPQDIDYSIELTTTDGQTITLKFVRMASDLVTVSMQNSQDANYKGWFQLSRETIARLRGPLTAAENPIK